MADIEHKALPDELLHEPKGASTAAAGTVYVANGNGYGVFQRLPLEYIYFVKSHVTEMPTIIYPLSYELNSNVSDVSNGTLEQVTSDVLKVDTLNQINKNTAEFAKFASSQNRINAATEQTLNELRESINDLINALKSEGLVA